MELWQIRQLLENIRYLENDGDSTQPSSETAENTAYDQIVDLQNQCNGSEFHLIRDFESLAYKPGEDKPIERIKVGKKPCQTLNTSPSVSS